MMIFSVRQSIKYHYLLMDFFVGILLIFLPIYCQQFLHFTEGQIGILYCVGSLSALVSAGINGVIAQKINDIRKILFYSIPTIFIGIFFLFFSTSFMMVIIAYIFIFYIRTIAYIIGDDIVINYLNSIGENNFSEYRSYGTIGWGCNLLVTGILISQNILYIFPILLAISLAFSINFFRLPKEKVTEDEKFEIKSIKELFKFRNYIIIVLVFMLFWSSVSNMQTFLQFTVLDLGGSIKIFSIINASVLIVDYLITKYSYKFLNKVGSEKYLISILLITSMKFLLLSLAINYFEIYTLAIFDPFIFGLTLPFISKIVKQETSKKLSTIALTITNMSMMLMTAFFYLIYGALYYNFGSNLVYLIMFSTTVISLLLVFKLKIK